MPEFDNKYGTLTIRAREVTDRLKQRLRRGIMRAAEETANQAKKNISIPTRATGPSLPGEMPHADTGRLRNSIFWRMASDLTAVVGSNLNYAIWLEYGVVGEKTVVAEPGKVFHWKGPGGEDIFRKSFTFRGLAPRPFMRPTLEQMRPRITSIISAAGGEVA